MKPEGKCTEHWINPGSIVKTRLKGELEGWNPAKISAMATHWMEILYGNIMHPLCWIYFKDIKIYKDTNSLTSKQRKELSLSVWVSKYRLQWSKVHSWTSYLSYLRCWIWYLHLNKWYNKKTKSSRARNFFCVFLNFAYTLDDNTHFSCEMYGYLFLVLIIYWLRYSTLIQTEAKVRV